MGDLISRQMTVKEIARWKGYLDDDMIFRIQTGIKRLPPALRSEGDGGTGMTTVTICMSAVAVIALLVALILDCMR